jgi:hypothetical protein
MSKMSTKKGSLKTLKQDDSLALKIEDKELAELKAIVKDVDNLHLQIGGLEANKHQLLHALATRTGMANTIQDKLKEKYGDVSIDINTGAIKRDGANKKD